LSDKFFFSFDDSTSDGAAIRRFTVSVLTIGEGVSVSDEDSIVVIGITNGVSPRQRTVFEKKFK
jgi:hypothetical protein